MTTGLYAINVYKRSIDPAEEYYMVYTYYVLAKSTRESVELLRKELENQSGSISFLYVQNYDDPIDITKPFFVGSTPFVSKAEAESRREGGKKTGATYFM